MSEEPIYDDGKMRIDYHTSPEDHVLYLKEEKGDELNFIIQRGILRELANTPRGGIERKIANFNPEMIYFVKKEGICIDGLHIALCQAHMEEQERVRLFRVKENID